MPNLINTDAAGNVFYNYITPVVKGEGLSGATHLMLDSFFAAKLGTKGTTWNSGNYTYAIRFPAPELEMKTGNITTNIGSTTLDGNARANFATGGVLGSINANTSLTSGSHQMGVISTAAISTAVTNVSFAVINDYSLVYCMFSDNQFTNLNKFVYLGWLREPVYTGTSVGVLGLVCILQQSTPISIRPSVANTTTTVTLSTAADSITSPPIVCTTGTDPGDGSAIATDIVIRDAASPNHPVGKLWNCIDLPADCVVGSIYRNAGNYDADASTSEKDFYLCVMPWGTRKLGMRVWTENVN